jgi:hypothetical protein
MTPKIRQRLARLAVVLAVGFYAAWPAFSQVDGSTIGDWKEKLSRTGVFFRADAPRTLRNPDDPNLPIFIEIINGVEQEAHTTGSSVSSRIKRSPLNFLGVNVFAKPTGSGHQFTVQPLLMASSTDFTFDARMGGQPLAIPERYKTTLEIPQEILQAFLASHFLGGPFSSVDLWVSIRATDWPDQAFYLRVQLNAPPLPKIPNWYRGDIHYHSGYTDNPAERGYPLEVTKQAALQAGVEWLMLSDHSTDLTEAIYEAELADVKRLRDAHLMLIRGEEVTTSSDKSAFFKTVHMLAAPSPDDPDKGFPDPKSPDIAVITTGDGSPSSSAPPLREVLARIAAAGGFAYAAHPFDPISPIVRGGKWDITEDFLAPGGKQLQPGLVGLEPWNRATTSTANDMHDPFCIHTHQDAVDCFQPDAVANQYARLENGIKLGWQPLLQQGLTHGGKDSDAPLFKTFLAAGSDAHGDVNFEATMDVTDFLGNATRSLNGYAEDNALGKLSTIVFAPSGVGARGENILRALRNGQTVASNGPILIAGFDRNKNGSLADPEDVGIGQEISSSLKSMPPLQLQWVSSEEFGPVQSIQLIVGTWAGELPPVEIPVSADRALDSRGLSPVDITPALKEGSPDWRYIRLVASTRNSSNSEFRCYTNPIWIKVTGD